MLASSAREMSIMICEGLQCQLNSFGLIYENQNSTRVGCTLVGGTRSRMLLPKPRWVTYGAAAGRCSLTSISIILNL